MAWVPRLPGLTEWARIVHHRQTLADKLSNLTIVPKKRLGADDILDYGAEVVILTTGSVWAADGLSSVTRAPLPGADADLPHVLTPDQIMVDGKRPVGDSVLVYDAEGYFMGVSLAERYAREGKHVIYVTPRSAIGAYMHHTGEDQLMIPLLAELGSSSSASTPSRRYRPGRSRVCRECPVGSPLRWDADSVVLVTQRNPRTGLYRELKSRSDEWSDAGIRGVYGPATASARASRWPTRSSTPIDSPARSTLPTRPCPCPGSARSGSSAPRTPTTTPCVRRRSRSRPS